MRDDRREYLDHAVQVLPFTAVMMAGVALNGTVWNSSPAIDLNSSAAMNWVPPMLVVPTLNLPDSPWRRR